MRKDLESNVIKGLRGISLKYLKENGFFKIDNRFVDKNFEYQYCASIIKKIDERIRKEKEFLSDVPLRGIFQYIMKQKEKSTCIENDLDRKSVV